MPLTDSPVLITTGIPELCPMIRTGEEVNHVSTILRSLCLKLGHYEDRDEEDRPQTMWEIGSAFERSVIRSLTERYALTFPDRYLIPGTLAFDGLEGNPDLIDLVEDKVVEVKLSWMSSRHDPEGEKFWKYWKQGQSYAKMWGTRTVQVHVCHINGDYKYKNGPEPIYNAWEWEFYQHEIDETWRMLKNEHARLLKKQR